MKNQKLYLTLGAVGVLLVAVVAVVALQGKGGNLSGNLGRVTNNSPIKQGLPIQAPTNPTAITSKPSVKAITKEACKDITLSMPSQVMELQSQPVTINIPDLNEYCKQFISYRLTTGTSIFQQLGFYYDQNQKTLQMNIEIANGKINAANNKFNQELLTYAKGGLVLKPNVVDQTFNKFYLNTGKDKYNTSYSINPPQSRKYHLFAFIDDKLIGTTSFDLLSILKKFRFTDAAGKEIVAGNIYGGKLNYEIELNDTFKQYGNGNPFFQVNVTNTQPTMNDTYSNSNNLVNGKYSGTISFDKTQNIGIPYMSGTKFQVYLKISYNNLSEISWVSPGFVVQKD